MSLRPYAALLRSLNHPRYIHSIVKLPARGSHSCSCNTKPLPSWPSPDAFPTPIDKTGHLTQIAPFTRHLLVDTSSQLGAHDWPPTLSLDKEGTSQSVASAITVLMATEAARFGFRERREKVLVNQVTREVHVSAPVKTMQDGQATRVLIMPDGVEATVTPQEATLLLDALAATSPPALSSSRLPASDRPSLLAHLKAQHPTWHPQPLASAPLIFFCGHKQRDGRCGLVAPILSAHARAHPAAASRESAHYYMDHMGGHKFAGNLVLYTPIDLGEQANDQGGGWQSVWYGRVEVDNLEEILKRSLERGETVDPLVRYASGHFHKSTKAP